MSSKMVLTVTSSTSATNLRISTSGRYKRLLTNAINLVVPGLPLYTSTTDKDYWLAVLAEATAQVTALPS